MSVVDRSGTFRLGDRLVRRLGYGAMRLSGPGVFGPPKNRDADALHSYLRDLIIVTKIGARRGEDASVMPAFSPEELTRAVHDNLRTLELDVLDVVNFRNMLGTSEAALETLKASLTVLAELQRQGLVRQIGLSSVTPAQIVEGRKICRIVCAQNQYNLAQRDALIDDLDRDRIAYVPFFPLGGFTPLQSSTLSGVAQRLGATPSQVALAWLLRRAPNILLIPGTSSVAHLRENLAAAELSLPDDALRELDGVTSIRPSSSRGPEPG